MAISLSQLSSVLLLVDDYDNAIDYFTQVLGFTLIDDIKTAEDQRFVTVAPSDFATTTILLGKAVTEQEKACIGNQAAGRVFMILHTTDFESDYKTMKSKGVKFRETPRKEPYGTVAIFEDKYGNLWDLLEPV